MTSFEFPPRVSPANDVALVVGPVTGIDPATGDEQIYPGATITAHWATVPTSDVPLGGVSGTVPVVAGKPGVFVASFEATQMSTVLAGLVDETPIYLVLIGTGDFRAVVPCQVQTWRALT